MKKTMFAMGLAACAVSFFAACKKDTTTTTPTTTGGAITINGTVYNETAGGTGVVDSFFGPNNVYAFEVLGSTTDGKKEEVYAFRLNTARFTAGTYNIGGTINLMAANQLNFLVLDSSAAGSGLYAPDSATTANAVITETNGKLSMTIPSVRCSGLFTSSVAGSSTQNDTVTVSGTLIER